MVISHIKFNSMYPWQIKICVKTSFSVHRNISTVSMSTLSTKVIVKWKKISYVILYLFLYSYIPLKLTQKVKIIYR